VAVSTTIRPVTHTALVEVYELPWGPGVDVQGFEETVLRGGPRTLERVDYVIVEVSFWPLYVGQASFHDIYALLRGLGFAYMGNLDQLLSPMDGRILQADALFGRQR
jgi:hypothetical protein